MNVHVEWSPLMPDLSYLTAFWPPKLRKAKAIQGNTKGLQATGTDADGLQVYAGQLGLP